MPDRHVLEAQAASSDETHETPTSSESSAAPASGVFWDRVCMLLPVKIGEENFERWFSNVGVETTDDGKVILTVPNPIHHLWIESNYAAPLSEVIEVAAGGPRHIEFRIESAAAGSNGKHPSLTVPLVDMAVRGGRLIGRAASDSEVVGAPSAEEVRMPRTLAEAGLNAKHCFDNFVVGTNSQYSVAVARAVAEKPGRIYNPLFFYGGTGLGKTHLMQAIGREILLSKKKAVVRYVTSEQFTNEFVEAIRGQSLPLFRRKYRKVDVLLIDDVHFFVGKDSTQEEFFHTFNELFNNSKQIVLASDCAPGELKSLEQRLVSRFEWGLTTQIQNPDFETRAAILQRKLGDLEDAPDMDPWILEFIAQRVRSNVRKLEGALSRVAAHVSLEGSAPANESALEALLHDVVDQEPTKTVSVDAIQRVVATHYDLRVGDLTGPRRPSNIALARQVAMYLTRHMTKLPLTHIGEEFGGRDHGTVIHACKVISARMKSADDFRKGVESLIAKIVGG
jgi:chromosomal replication initiator protein